MKLSKESAKILNMRSGRSEREVADRVAIELVLTHGHEVELEASIPEAGGRADIVDHTSEEVIEVKAFGQYKKAVSQVKAYAKHYGYRPVVYLYTKNAKYVEINKGRRKEAEAFCKKYGVVVRYE